MKTLHQTVSKRHRFRPAFSTLTLSLVLAGCATSPNPNADANSQLVVHTSTGHGWRQEGPPRTTASPLPEPAARTHAAPLRSATRTTTPATPAAANRSSSADNITLNFVGADLQGVVRALARFTGRNFVVDPRVKGQLTLVSEVPVDSEIAYSMLLSALRMQGFAVVDVDGVSRVVPEADAKLQGTSVSSGVQPAGAHSGELVTRVFQLRYENAINIVPILRPMIAPNNPINAYTGNNTLVITDYADNLDRIAQVIAGIDTPHSISTDVVPIRYGVALDVAALAAQLLDSRANGDAAQRTIVVADPRSNSVLLRASSPDKLVLARDLVKRIDSPESRAGNLHVVYLRNAQAIRLAEVLRGALSGQNGGNGIGSDTDAAGSGGGLSGGLAGGNSPLGLSEMSTAARATTGSMSGAGGNKAAGMGGYNGILGGSSGGQSNLQPIAFTAGGATVQADPSTNTLIISAPDPLYRSLREVIDQLDQRRAQVLVESLIVEVNADDAAEFGIQWMAGGNNINSGDASFIGGANLGGSGINANPRGRTTIDALAAGLSLGVVKGTVNILGSEILNLGVLARAMQSKVNANVLSTPNLMTMDNEEASIIVGQTVPFVTGQYTTSGDGSSNPFQTITREDVGLTLRIRPQISEGGTVKLALYQEVSSLDPASTQATGLITRKRALQTNVLVDDGQIIVLGGLLEDTVSGGTSSVPLLGDIPLLGNLFRYDTRSRKKTNLMVFLRPHIVRNAQDGASVTLDRYNYMRAAQARLPPRATWFAPDNGMRQLPQFDRNPNTGLLDLRDGDEPLPMSAPASSDPGVTPIPTASPARSSKL